MAAFMLAPRFAAAQYVTMTPSPLDAGGVVLGTSGTVYGTFSPTSGTGIGTVDFQIASCSGGGGTIALSPNAGIPFNGAQTIAMTFTPSARGTMTCTVNALRSGIGIALGSFTVRGTGYVAQTMDTSGSGAFGSVRFANAAPGHTAAQNITVQNNGDVTLSIGSVAISGTNAADFALTNGPTSTTILPGNAKTWTVTFDPTAAGARNATLTFTGDAPVNPTDAIALGGTGTSGVIAVSDANFGIVNAGSAALLDITVANNGGAPSKVASNCTNCGSSVKA
jgi:hypothetical protein